MIVISGQKTYYGRKYHFNNPVKQNHSHVKACNLHDFLKELKVLKGVLSFGTPSSYLCRRIAEAGCYALAAVTKS